MQTAVTFTAAERRKLAGWAKVPFEPVDVPGGIERLNVSDALAAQHVFMFRVALGCLGKSKPELVGYLDMLAENGGSALREADAAMVAAAEFFKAANDICEVARARTIIAGAASVTDRETA